MSTEAPPASKPIPVRHQRQRFLAEHFELQPLSVLEIGAMDAPTWLGDPRPRRLRYLDWFSGGELAAMHRGNPNRQPERQVRVDYVVKEKHFASHVSERFDLVVANHVLEHIADPITWLAEVAAVTEPGGHLCMAVPDRHYTFDYLRPESTVVELLRAHEEDLSRPDYWQYLESLYLYRPLKAPDCWPGPPPAEQLSAARFDLATAMQRARRANEEYVDCHCFVFSEQSFEPLVSELHEAGLIPWRVAAVRGVLELGNEFMVLLQRDS